MTPRPGPNMRALVTGWFSYEGMRATAGDLIVRDVVSGWLDDAGIAHDVADGAVGGSLSLVDVVPDRYDVLVFACGPFGNGPPITDLLETFADARVVGVNLSMLEPIAAWNPFDVLLARDSDQEANADVAFAGRAETVPVVGRIEVGAQPEYRDRVRHAEVGRAISTLLGSRDLAVVEIDTEIEENRGGLRTPAQIEGVIAKMDAVVTTRVHGTVFALRAGVPPLVIDPIAGGAKVAAHARAIGWPLVLTADECETAALNQALDRCLCPEATTLARDCAARARLRVDELRRRFLDGIVP